MKTFQISYNLILNKGGRRLLVRHIEANTNVEAIMKLFNNCPVPQHFELVDCLVVDDNTMIMF